MIHEEKYFCIIFSTAVGNLHSTFPPYINVLFPFSLFMLRTSCEISMKEVWLCVRMLIVWRLYVAHKKFQPEFPSPHSLPSSFGFKLQDIIARHEESIFANKQHHRITRYICLKIFLFTIVQCVGWSWSSCALNKKSRGCLQEEYRIIFQPIRRFLALSFPFVIASVER